VEDTALCASGHILGLDRVSLGLTEVAAWKPTAPATILRVGASSACDHALGLGSDLAPEAG
jgi:hypothetical protein